jgi:WD40 repeat protein
MVAFFTVVIFQKAINYHWVMAGVLWLSSAKRNLSFWDLASGECLQTLHGHTDNIYPIIFHKNKIMSWSEEKQYAYEN